MERVSFSMSPAEIPEGEARLTFEELKAAEQKALAHWADILNVAKQQGIDLESILDAQESDPSYKEEKERLLKLKDETLKILFELDNEKEKLKKMGYAFGD